MLYLDEKSIDLSKLSPGVKMNTISTAMTALRLNEEIVEVSFRKGQNDLVMNVYKLKKEEI